MQDLPQPQDDTVQHLQAGESLAEALLPPELVHAVIDGTFYVLLIFSVLTWVVILFKTWQFFRNNQQNKQFDHAFWQADSLENAKELAPELSRGPQAQIAQCGFSWLDGIRCSGSNRLKYQGDKQDLLAQALHQQTQQEVRKMESGLTLLASIGSTAPFVGLFGTVVGIMHAMHDITKAKSTSLNIVAGPIGEALIATAIGIAVAVPAVLAYNFFLRRVKDHRAVLENFSSNFLNVAKDVN